MCILVITVLLLFACVLIMCMCVVWTVVCCLFALCCHWTGVARSKKVGWTCMASTWSTSL